MTNEENNARLVGPPPMKKSTMVQTITLAISEVPIEPVCLYTGLPDFVA
jgi:hypothetical protein